MTTVTQDKPRPPWRNTLVADWVRGGQRGVAARRYVRAHNRSLPADAPTLTFFPMLPTRRMHMALMLDELGLRIGTSLAPAGATIAWETGTWFSMAEAARLPATAINGRCLDISKSCVDRAWAAASPGCSPRQKRTAP